MLVSTTYNIHVGALICLKLQCFLQCSGGPNPAIHSLDTNEFGESLIWKESRTHQLYGVSENLWCLDDLLTNSKSSTFSENLWWMDDLLTNSKSSTFSENLYGVWMIYSPTLSHQSSTFSENLWSLDDLLTNSKSSTFSENLWCLNDFSQGLSQCLPHRPGTAALRTAASKMSAPLPGSPRQKMVLPEPDISTASPCRGFPPSDLCRCRNLSDYDEPMAVAMVFQEVHETHVR